MVTQEQIARKLGISRQLVSFALSGYPQVSEKSRQRILAAAKEMGYTPNPHARALRGERTGIIALWVPDQVSSHYTHVAQLAGIGSQAQIVISRQPVSLTTGSNDNPSFSVTANVVNGDVTNWAINGRKRGSISRMPPTRLTRFW